MESPAKPSPYPVAIKTFSRPHDPFAKDPNYRLIRGNPYYGIIVLYPQIHFTSYIKLNQQDIDEIYASQKSIFQDFILQEPKHIYDESRSLSYIESFKQDIELKAFFYRLILDKLDHNHELSPTEQQCFIDLGGALFYVARCYLNNKPVTLHPTVADKDIPKTRAMMAKVESQHPLDSQDIDFIVSYREAEIVRAINQTTDERNGEPAFIVLGKGHQCESAFQERCSPAFYRRIT